jgi:hypothetical protein
MAGRASPHLFRRHRRIDVRRPVVSAIDSFIPL